MYSSCNSYRRGSYSGRRRIGQPAASLTRTQCHPRTFFAAFGACSKKRSQFLMLSQWSSYILILSWFHSSTIFCDVSLNWVNLYLSWKGPRIFAQHQLIMHHPSPSCPSLLLSCWGWIMGRHSLAFILQGLNSIGYWKLYLIFHIEFSIEFCSTLWDTL